MIYIFTLIFLYLMYRFVTGFVLPVARATRDMRQQFGHMKEQMQQQPHSAPGQQATPPRGEKPQFDIEGEYIPFEEVK